ncbi:unnamed protein product [Lactuca saligna]|uniref:Uncharacterized protein n=1 Tax=Lactuca saligna TaxID=75948 RepID=A0AA35YEG7_LACSI|nr:unnamed protein product [Lactuca saligna]
MIVEITSVLKKRPVLKPEEEPKNLYKLKLAKTQKENWFVVYKQKEGQEVLRNMFFLRFKHLYSTTALNSILGLTEACKGNTSADHKYFLVMIKWYLMVKTTLYNLMLKLLKVHKRQQSYSPLVFGTKGEIFGFKRTVSNV